MTGLLFYGAIVLAVVTSLIFLLALYQTLKSLWTIFYYRKQFRVLTHNYLIELLALAGILVFSGSITILMVWAVTTIPWYDVP